METLLLEISWGTILWWAIPLALVASVIFLAVTVFKAAMIIVPQNHVVIVERFGKYRKTIKAGMHFVFPFIDRPNGKAIFMGDRIMSLFCLQDKIEFSDGSAAVDVRLYWRVRDEKDFRYASQDPIASMQQKMRKVVADFLGEHEMIKVNKDRAVVNLPSVIMEADLPLDDISYLLHPIFLVVLGWGIEILAIDLIDIKMSQKYIDAMDKVYEAKKDQELAEEQQKAKLKRAETDKEEMSIKADGERTAEIKRGEGKAIARGAMVEKEGRATAQTLEEQLKRLSVVVGKEQAVSLLVNNKKWSSVGADTIIIDNHGSSDSDVARGAGFASGSEAVKAKLQVKKGRNQGKNQVGE